MSETIVIFLIVIVFLNLGMKKSEGFSAKQKMSCSHDGTDSKKPKPSMDGRKSTVDYLKQQVIGADPYFDGLTALRPRGSTKDYESLIFDDTTGAIMTGTQFMENTGVVAPLWIPPAWDPDAYGPSSKGELDPSDYEDDPRMLYNKCSLSCCAAQYPTPHQGTTNPFVCGSDGKNKYYASDYICQNNTGGTGCLCMTEKQIKGLQKGFVDYYADEDLGY